MYEDQSWQIKNIWIKYNFVYNSIIHIDPVHFFRIQFFLQILLPYLSLPDIMWRSREHERDQEYFLYDLEIKYIRQFTSVDHIRQ